MTKSFFLFPFSTVNSAASSTGKLLGLLAPLFFLMACGSDEKLSDVRGDVTVRVPWLSSDLDLGLGDPVLRESKPGEINGDSLSSQPRFENIRLHGLNNLQKVSGEAAQFLMYPTIEGHEVHGLAPEAKFVKSDRGYYSPLNFLSAQLISLYAHLERLLKLDEKIGLQPQLGTRTVLITSLEETAALVNNAFYKSDIDTLIFIPYSQEHLPISVNPGIIAHEHFHAQFHRRFYLPLVQRKVLSPVLMRSLHESSSAEQKPTSEANSTVVTPPSPSQPGASVAGVTLFESLSAREQDYFRVLIQGLNEGLADVWGWVYTGRPNFLSLSLPQVGQSRNLKSRFQAQANAFPFRTKCNVIRELRQIEMLAKSSSDRNQFVLGTAYGLGTEFGRIFHLAAEISREEKNISYAQARMELARQIYEFLPALAYGVEKTRLNINPLDVLAIYAQELKSLSARECDFWKRLLNTPVNDTDATFECRANLNSERPTFALRSSQGQKVFSARSQSASQEAPCR